AHLVRESLKCQPVVGRGEGAGRGIVWALVLLRRQELVDGFLEPPLQQLLVAFERDVAAGSGRCAAGAVQEPGREMEAVDGVEKKQRAHALIEIVAPAADGIQRRARVKQLSR